MGKVALKNKNLITALDSLQQAIGFFEENEKRGEGVDFIEHESGNILHFPNDLPAPFRICGRLKEL